MNRRAFWPILGAWGVAAVVPGCLLPSKRSREEGADQPLRWSERTEELDPTLERPKELQRFFRPTRQPGGLSDEALDIERSLGVGS